MNANAKLILICFLCVIAVLSSALSLHNMIYKADTLPAYHTDETANLQAAVSFFRTGVYTCDRYGLAYSSGIAVTWPGAAGWYVCHNMLAARIGCALFSWI